MFLELISKLSAVISSIKVLLVQATNPFDTMFFSSFEGEKVVTFKVFLTNNIVSESHI
jgi:hypothetical protein